MWRTKPTDRFVLKWIKLHLAAHVTPWLAGAGWVRPVHVTVASALLGVTAGVLLAVRCGWQAGCVAAVAQVLDGVDGQLARLTQRASRAGAFWDSVLDRYADGALMIGATIYALRVSVGVPAWLVAAAGALALIGGGLISFSSARAAALGIDLGAPTLASKGTRTGVMILAAWATLIWRGAPLLALGYLALHTNVEVMRRLRRARATGARGAADATRAAAPRGEVTAAPAAARGVTADRAPASADALVEAGFIHGRFQILHNDHLEYLLAAKARCRHLIVGITNPDPTLTRTERVDPARSSPLANPLTYFERALLVRTALMDAGVSVGDFTIVPFPVNVPELYIHYVPAEATFFLSIYDDWGREKRARFQRLGLRTCVLWERPLEEKGIRGSAIRERMRRGEEWTSLVPPGVAQLLVKWDIAGRLRGLQQAVASGEPEVAGGPAGASRGENA
jgi:phosphatidylglycerophosphate synthase